MQTFVIKDLMISVLTNEMGDVASCAGYSSGPPCSGICPGTKDPIPELGEGIILETNPVILAALRKELEKQLNAVVERQRIVAMELAPKKAQDVAFVRNQLTEALAHLGTDIGDKK